MMTPHKFTLKDLITLEDMARKLAIKPKVITTQEEADAANRSEKIFKRKFRKKWKIGDKYYDLSDIVHRIPQKL